MSARLQIIESNERRMTKRQGNSKSALRGWRLQELNVKREPLKPGDNMRQGMLNNGESMIEACLPVALPCKHWSRVLLQKTWTSCWTGLVFSKSRLFI
jgi:hypothetical protein